MKNEPLERVFRRFPHGGMAPIVRQLLSHTRLSYSSDKQVISAYS